MKTERSILVFVSLSLLALAIFTSYNTPQVNGGTETEYMIDMDGYKREVAARIAIDSSRMKELSARFEIKENVYGKDDEDELAILDKKINGMQIVLNNYEENGLEEWELFKEKFENDLTEYHERLIKLTIKTSNSLTGDNTIQSLAKP